MTYLPVDVIIDNKAKQIHRIDTLNLLAYVSLLVFVLVTTWFFKRRRHLYIHETGLAILYGLIMGACLRYFGLEVNITSRPLVDQIPMSVPDDYIIIKATSLGDKTGNKTHVYAYEFRGEIEPHAKLGSQISYASVDPEVFFNIILPPIVLNAGLSLKRRHFFRNIGAIFSYAFIGTTISVAFVGSFIYGSINLIKYLTSYTFLADQFSLANCLYFGAIISPTDPLAVLAIFQELGVDVNLFALVFGESILNDAVSIVLTHSIGHFSVVYGRDPYYSIMWLIFECVYNFINMLFTSCLIGILFGIITALTTKFTKLTESPLLETSLLVLMSYTSFLIAEVIDASGIVAILLCGITQAHYTINNLSFEARERIKNLFELMTFLCENFLFLAVGVCFWQRGQEWNLTFVAIAFVGVTVARIVSVYPLTVLLNLGRTTKIPMSFQHVITCSGLARGVISYSLASRNTVGDARRIMLSTTSAIVIVSVVSVGSSMSFLVKWLKIPLCSSMSSDAKSTDAICYDNDDDDGSDYRAPGTILANNPSWLVRPKRLNRRGSYVTDQCLCHFHHQHHHQPHHFNGSTNRRRLTTSQMCQTPLDTTPILEIDSLAHQRAADATCRQVAEHQSSSCLHHRRPTKAPRSRQATLQQQQQTPQTTTTDNICDCSFVTAAAATPYLHSGDQLSDLQESADDQTQTGAPGKRPSCSGSSIVVGGSVTDINDDLVKEQRLTQVDCDNNNVILGSNQKLEGESVEMDAANSNEAVVAADGNNNNYGYENASLVRQWRKLDNNFIKPLLTNSQPNLMETLPPALSTLARLFTSDEQLMRCQSSIAR